MKIERRFVVEVGHIEIWTRTTDDKGKIISDKQTGAGICDTFDSRTVDRMCNLIGPLNPEIKEE